MPVKFFSCRSWIRVAVSASILNIAWYRHLNSRYKFVVKSKDRAWVVVDPLDQVFLGSLSIGNTQAKVVLQEKCGGTSPLCIKAQCQISEFSKNGSWVLVDARRFLLPTNILTLDLFCTENVNQCMCMWSMWHPYYRPLMSNVSIFVRMRSWSADDARNSWLFEKNYHNLTSYFQNKWFIKSGVFWTFLLTAHI